MKRRAASLRPLSPEDIWLKDAYQSCARDMARWLKSTVNVERPIRSMTLAEMSALAEVAIVGWRVAATLQEDKENQEDQAVTSLLL